MYELCMNSSHWPIGQWPIQFSYVEKNNTHIFFSNFNRPIRSGLTHVCTFDYSFNLMTNRKRKKSLCLIKTQSDNLTFIVSNFLIRPGL